MTSFVSPRRVRNSHGDLPVRVACIDEGRLFGSTNITDHIAWSHLGAPVHVYVLRYLAVSTCIVFHLTCACATEIISFHIWYRWKVETNRRTNCYWVFIGRVFFLGYFEGALGNVSRTANWERKTSKREMSDGGQ